MSRSYKKPYVTDQQSGRQRSVQAKRRAARKVRAANKKACQEDDTLTLADNKQYRKASCSWNIRDWSFRDPLNPKSRRK